MRPQRREMNWGLWYEASSGVSTLGGGGGWWLHWVQMRGWMRWFLMERKTTEPRSTWPVFFWRESSYLSFQILPYVPPHLNPKNAIVKTDFWPSSFPRGDNPITLSFSTFHSPHPSQPQHKWVFSNIYKCWLGSHSLQIIYCWGNL